jgi:RimJ/RimL family protein N-acetyltransferase
MFIRSERLFLRPAWPEDAHDLYTAIADARIIRNLAASPWPYTPEDARAFIAAKRDRRLLSLLITLPGASGSRLIGGVQIHYDEGRAELSTWLVPDVWGRAFATEAASAALRLAHILGHRQIAARAFLDNRAAVRVLDKLGFRRTGRLFERHSAARGGVVPSREYLLRMDCNGYSDDPSPPGECEDGKRAA